MSSTNLNVGEIVGFIYKKLREHPTDNLAFPEDYVMDTISDFYENIFNQGRTLRAIKEAVNEFTTIADVRLDGDLSVGDLSVVLTDSSKLPSTGRILVDNEFITYTANDNLTTLTCAAGEIDHAHDDGATVRALYRLPTDIDKQRVMEVNINGIPYVYKDYGSMFNKLMSNYRNFTVFDGYLILPENNASQQAFTTYTSLITRFTTDTDIPTLLPNQWRVALLVNGPLGRLKREDGQADWDTYWRPSQGRGDKGGGVYFDELRKFYSTYGRRVDTRQRTKGSVYD